MIDTIRFDSLAAGPHLLFLGGVHGDEVPGVLSLVSLIEDMKAGRFRLLRGKVTIAPRVNAGAVKRGVHFLDENLNRIVRRRDAPATHEQILANELTLLIGSADAVLDLHGTPAPTRPFAFLDDESPENRAWAEALGADYLLCGWPALFDSPSANRPGGKTVTTTEYAQSLGKRALTVEVGQNDDATSAAHGRAFALRSLAHFGLTAPASTAKTSRALRLTAVVYREREGSFARPWSNFDPVKAGQVLARYADGEELTAPEDGVVIMPFEGSAIGAEWYYLAVAA